MAETMVTNGDVEICAEAFGDPDGVPLLLVMGLGAQHIAWDDELCEGFVDRGFYVLRYDNRDVGRSTKFDGDPSAPSISDQFATALAGGELVPAYRLSDMATDGIAVLDHFGVDTAHVVGASMGGMIAQTIAIEHPDRVRTLTSIMSTTGDGDVGQPTPEAMELLLQPPAPDRDAAIERSVESSKFIGSPAWFDEDRTREHATVAYDRCFYPDGVARQLIAILASGSRADGLRALAVPTLVIHGDVDPLVTPTGGQRTAELVPGAELVMIEGMGHDLPRELWPQVIEAVTTLAANAA